MIEDDTLDVEAEAAGLIQVAVRRLAHGYPFHAALIAQFRISVSRTVETAGVTIRQSEIHLVYNAEFVTKCTLAELEGVLHHELNHVILGHLLLDPADYPDDNAFLVATEVTVNEFVGEPLPGKPILLARFPMLPPGEDTDARYRRLARPKTRQGGTDRVPRGHEPAQTGQNPAQSGQKKVPPGQASEPLQSLDDHEIWSEARDSGDLGRLVVRESVRTARGTLTHDQLEALPAGLRQAAASVVGDAPGHAVEQLGDRRGRARLDWRVLLRRYLRRELERRPSFNRPPRRFPALVGIIPGHAHRHSTKNKPVVMAALDTSGSMDAPTLEAISVELNALRRRYRVTVVECDCMIHAIYELTGPLTNVHGRGGTDFHPPFEPETLDQVRPDVVIYFTDGCGPAPSRVPRVPVIWCITPGGQIPAPWGRVVRLG